MIAFAYYLLKVILCSGILFLYYHLALRNKLFHQWNRFYLLVSIFISLIAPVVQVSIMHTTSEEPNKAIRVLRVIQSADGYLEEVTIGGHQPVSTDQWLTMAFIIVSGLFLISVLLSFQKIFSIVRSHSIQRIETIKFVNTEVRGTPFSFFNFIFWNRDIDLQTETGQQIFQHELVHVKEKHTLDKLFVQLALVVFWCNPFIWLIRRELKLIHEFIADKKAVGEHGTAALAAMILNSTYPSQFNSITNQFFQTSIKRRLAMLTKIQNPKINYVSRLLALPILAATVLAFTLRTKTVTVSEAKPDKPITVVIDAGHGIMSNGKPNGASIDGISEDEITLAIAKKIKELSTDPNLKIVLTRPTSEIVDLPRRVEIAKENNADLFISLHVNAASNNNGSQQPSNHGLNKGFEVWVASKPTTYQHQSEQLASSLQQELSSVYGTNQYILKRQAAIWVLDHNICPSVLVECGFLTDKNDREFITEKENQARIAKSILQAVRTYALNQQEGQNFVPDTVPHKKAQVREVIIKDNSSSAQANTNQSGSNTSSQSPPLYLVDGKETIKSEIDKIDPSTIQSINVLKDRAAIEKYGNRGTNGVVEIWLKSEKIVQEVVYKVQASDTVPKKRNEKVTAIFVDGKKLKPDEVRVQKISWEQARKSKMPVVVDDVLKGSMDKVQLNQADIGSVSIAHGLPLVRDYGDDAAAGVIMITTKNYKRPGVDEPIFTRAEKEASIDTKEWTRFLNEHLSSFINEAAKNSIKPGTYTVRVRFLVKKDGSVSDIKVLNDPGYGMAKKVEDIMKDSPKWNPALQNGKPVHSYHTQPIKLVIQEQ